MSFTRLWLTWFFTTEIFPKENKALIRESFPKELSLEDFKKLELSYREMIEDDGVMSELESIIDFALPQIKGSLTKDLLFMSMSSPMRNFTGRSYSPLCKGGISFCDTTPGKRDKYLPVPGQYF